MVCVSKSPSLYIPKAFTPSNQDLKNNKWQVIINEKKSIQNFNLKIFDKFGRVIFETNSIDNGWDGTSNNKLAPCGVYIYKIYINYAQGEQLTETGSITLLR